MSRAVETLRVIWFAILSGAHDYFAIYTLKSWIAGWLVRVLSQVTFFALIGRFLQSEERTEFFLIGNAVMVAGMAAIFALFMTTAERGNGSLPLLIASPSEPVIVFAARGIYVVADGIFSALLGLFIIAPIFDVPMPWPRVLAVIPLTALVGLSAYCFSTFLAGIAIRWREAHGLLINSTIVTLMTLCGVNVPIDFFPTPIEWLANVLPITNGLQAIRDTLDGGSAMVVLANVGIEFGVAAAWLTLALTTFGRFISAGRRDGSLEFAS
jgi:ABC-2 type transport system permease protein